MDMGKLYLHNFPIGKKEVFTLNKNKVKTSFSFKKLSELNSPKIF